jgi:hypothetical protein
MMQRIRASVTFYFDATGKLRKNRFFDEVAEFAEDLDMRDGRFF